MKRNTRFAAREILPAHILGLAENADQIWAASPYVTSARLFARCSAADSTLYTDFNALNFLTGASSLRTLRSLLESGVSIRHVDSLHAKVILIDECHFSLGSQNLTYQGQKNIEANVISGDSASPEAVIRFFVLLRDKSREILMADLEEMERLVEPLISKFKTTKKEAEDIDQEIQSTLAEREAAKAEAFRRRQRMRNALLRFRRAVEPANQPAFRRVICSVQTICNISQNDWGKPHETYTNSLVPLDGRNFLTLIRSAGVSPRRLSRYLMIDQDTGKISFVRLAKSRITYFANGVEYHQVFRFGGHEFQVRIEFVWNEERALSRNGIAILKKKGRTAAFRFDFAFFVDGLDLFESEPDSTENEAPRFRSIDLSNSDFRNALESYLGRVLTNPFKYEHNLIGKQALDFFGERHPAKFEIRAHRFHESVILISKRLRL